MMGIKQIRLEYIWYDMWMGLYIDEDKNRWYVGLLPRIILIIDWKSS